MAKAQAPIPTDLTEMKQKWAEWRSAQAPRTPLPDSLWQPITQLARKHGLYRTAKSLPIDYGPLQRRCMVRPVRRRTAAPASFVELIAPPAPTTSYTIELVRIEAHGAVDWSQLLDAWRRRGA